jgi:hypothetical protein
MGTGLVLDKATGVGPNVVGELYLGLGVLGLVVFPLILAIVAVSLDTAARYASKASVYLILYAGIILPLLHGLENSIVSLLRETTLSVALILPLLIFAKILDLPALKKNGLLKHSS